MELASTRERELFGLSLRFSSHMKYSMLLTGIELTRQINISLLLK